MLGGIKAPRAMHADGSNVKAWPTEQGDPEGVLPHVALPLLQRKADVVSMCGGLAGAEVEVASRDEDDSGAGFKPLVFPEVVVALVNTSSL